MEISPRRHGLVAALAQRSRLRIVRALAGGRCCVTELAGRVGLSQSCTTRHLQALERAGWVRGAREGKRVSFTLRTDSVAVVELVHWLAGGARPPSGAGAPGGSWGSSGDPGGSGAGAGAAGGGSVHRERPPAAGATPARGRQVRLGRAGAARAPGNPAPPPAADSDTPPARTASRTVAPPAREAEPSQEGRPAGEPRTFETLDDYLL